MISEKTHIQSSSSALAHLARLYGVQTDYRDAFGHLKQPSVESLLRTLLVLGAQVKPEEGPAAPGLAEAVRHHEVELAGRTVEPVTVAWDGRLSGMTVRLPPSGGEHVGLSLVLEDGTDFRGELPRAAVRTGPGERLDGRSFMPLELAGRLMRGALGEVAGRLPWGYHRLRVEAGGAAGETLLISAPRRCWEGEADAQTAPTSHGAETSGWAGHRGGMAALKAGVAALAGRPWGLFAPVYALRSGRDWGAGDLADLRTLAAWAAEAGAGIVATLPLLASFVSGEEADASPYRPLTRLFWNEFYLAPEETHEWDLCAAARSHPAAERWETERRRLRASELVDYQAVTALKTPVLAELARCFFAEGGAERRREFEHYLHANPHVRDYAAFRAAQEPASGSRPGAGGGWASADEQYHLYCQWQLDGQMKQASSAGGARLLFDLPLGVHPRGFDVGLKRGLFAAGASTGAPPDTFFSAGQDWDTPPLHPRTDREQGYAYFRACLRNLMRPASVVRIDHMMSFHRLFWIPEGARPVEGVYVTYPAEELYAVLSCESHRHRAAVVGEDLGTVPPGVRASMRRHGVARTAVFLGALRPRGKTLDVDVPTGSLVTLETHDMVPLAGFLHGDDIETRVETGQVDRRAARREAAARRHLVARLAERFGAPTADPDRAASAILAGCLKSMAASPAKIVLVSLADLLLERRPQNVPGTGAEQDNWRRKAEVTVEDLPVFRRSATPTRGGRTRRSE